MYFQHCYPMSKRRGISVFSLDDSPLLGQRYIYPSVFCAMFQVCYVFHKTFTLQHCKKYIVSLQCCLLSVYLVQRYMTRENGDNEKVVYNT